MNNPDMRTANRSRPGTGLAVIALLSLSTSAMAATLPSALVQAYQSNPELLAARAALRSTDEEVAIARSGYRPKLSIDATASETDQDSGTVGQGRVGLQIDQSLFDGFVTRNTVRSAIAQIDSERGSLSSTEQNVLLSAITAYVDVRRDSDVIGIREANLDFLAQQVRSAQTRFEVGNETNTAIAEAQAREADAVAQLARARAQLVASEAAYREIIGVAPTDLRAAELPEALLPMSLPKALDLALQLHPDLTSAAALAQSARFDVDRTRGTLRPSLGLSARVEHVEDDLAMADVRSQGGGVASVSLQLQVPLYQAGLASARVRQARQIVEQRDQQVQGVTAQILTSVRSAWAQLDAARAAQSATQTQIESAQLARDGKLNEQDVGLVTTLDVLNAQQDVLAANLAASGSQRDTIVASYTLLATTGRLHAAALGVPVETYEPTAHFDAVNRQWFGTRVRDER